MSDQVRGTHKPQGLSPAARALASRKWFVRLALRVARWFIAECELCIDREPPPEDVCGGIHFDGSRTERSDGTIPVCAPSCHPT
jgi:hypothetical protein